MSALSEPQPPLVMLGLVPGIHGLQHGDMRKGGGWVYIMTNRPNGTLYLGVTSDIARRAWQHREGLVEGFTKRYRLTRLVYAERHDDIATAIQRGTDHEALAARLEGQSHRRAEPRLGRPVPDAALIQRQTWMPGTNPEFFVVKPHNIM